MPRLGATRAVLEAQAQTAQREADQKQLIELLQEALRFAQRGNMEATEEAIRQAIRLAKGG